jgi:amphi-Trp domain-containing protein
MRRTGRIEGRVPKPDSKPVLREGECIMTPRKAAGSRDIEVNYPRRQFIAKLRRLADCLEKGERFRIQIGGERVSIPASAVINLEHERGSAEEEVEFQLKWSSES